MTILGIETSCDETSVALLSATDKRFKLHEHLVASQVALHQKFGGVVPEIAARKHIEVLLPLIQHGIGAHRLRSVDLIAATAGPGLITSLMVGVQAAKTISYVLKKPLVGIHHLEAHIYANWLTHPELIQDAARFFPALVLIVSGGHTQLLLMHGYGFYELLGQTLDDAAGEAFDKVAKLLGLGYPGGPQLAALADQGNSTAIDFPRPLIQSTDYNVSFSGLKTAVLYYLEQRGTVRKRDLPDIAASFQQAVVDVLIAKINRAIKAYAPRSLMLAGGVSANRALRTTLAEHGHRAHIPVFIPALTFTGDNAAMIAAAAYFRRHEGSRTAWKTLMFNPQLTFTR